MANVIIDEELILNVDTGVIGLKSNQEENDQLVLPIEELNDEIDKLEVAITNLEESFDPNTVSSLSQQGREGIYLKQGLITNIIIGIVIALIVIVLIV
ncbi:MAG: tetrahydromethanopterin S-methyltransferase subunit B [Methanosphaera sp.]|nr:tetrahydromethanopterin S-methyltransferase subunit B [Methanosphaera sp.]